MKSEPISSFPLDKSRCLWYMITIIMVIGDHNDYEDRIKS